MGWGKRWCSLEGGGQRGGDSFALSGRKTTFDHFAQGGAVGCRILAFQADGGMVTTISLLKLLFIILAGDGTPTGFGLSRFAGFPG